MAKKRIRKTGWEPLPASMKVVFVLTIITLVFGLTTLSAIIFNPYILLFGFMIKGDFALFLQIAMLFAHFVLLVAIYKRKKWTWQYGLILYSFFVLSLLGSLFRMSAAVNEMMISYPRSIGIPRLILYELVKIILVASHIFGLILSAVIAYLFLRARKYFE